MNSDREPTSSPALRRKEEAEELDSGDISDSNCGESYTPADGSEGKGDDSDARDDDDDDDDDDDEDENGHNDSDIPSSPPTSVETGSKNDQRAGGAEISNDGYRAPAVETEDEEDVDAPREYFTHYGTTNDTFSAHRKNWEDSSQWEDEDGPPAHAHATRASPPPARVQSRSSSRKSPAPSSPMFPPRPRQTGSTKSHLSHQFTHRPSPASRASSGSYDARELHRDEKKPPLVLLHVTLLILSGAEEVVLRHLTPTTLERGVLIEHPRGDYNLLEELILDGLGLEDDEPVSDPTEAEEPAEKTWEQALNIMPNLPAKKAWQLRVYASNGLMTPGAWKRVWAEMERIDVEIWPRGYDRNGRSTRSPVGGGHSRGTSTSSVLPYPSDDGATATDEPEYDDRRKSLIGATVVRHGNGASMSTLGHPTSPAPTKARRMRSRAPATAAGFEFNKLLTPRAVMVYAGINMLLFLYFTVFRFVDFGGAWSSSVALFRAGEMEGVLVQEVEERRPFEAGSEGCSVVEAVSVVEMGMEMEMEMEVVVEAVVEDGVVADVKIDAGERVLADDETNHDNAPNPEINAKHHDQDAQILLGEGLESYGLEEEEELDAETTSDETIEGEVQLDLEEIPSEQSEVVNHGDEVNEELLGEPHKAGLDFNDAETVAQDGVEAEVEAEEVGVEGKPKFGFLKGFGFS